MLAEKLDFLYVDTGAMYRALTLKSEIMKLDYSDVDSVVRMAEQTCIELKKDADNKQLVLLDGKDVTSGIRTPEITNSVFYIARMSQVRRIMVGWQRQYGRDNSIVMEGRDIGTDVFPNADKKFYLDASAEIRAGRRMLELRQKGIEISFEQLISQIKDRDNKDKTRECGPLKMADDAVYIDSSDMTIDAVVQKMLEYIKDDG